MPSESLTPKIIQDAETVQRLFDDGSKGMPYMSRQLAVKRFHDAQQNCIEIDKLCRYLTTFQYLALSTALGRSSRSHDARVLSVADIYSRYNETLLQHYINWN